MSGWSNFPVHNTCHADVAFWFWHQTQGFPHYALFLGMSVYWIHIWWHDLFYKCCCSIVGRSLGTRMSLPTTAPFWMFCIWRIKTWTQSQLLLYCLKRFTLVAVRCCECLVMCSCGTNASVTIFLSFQLTPQCDTTWSYFSIMFTTFKILFQHVSMP